MDKTATLNLRVNPDVKKSAESVLYQLGVPMATAVDMFLKQITLTGSIPFAVALPKAPDKINIDKMDITQIRQMIDEGLDDIVQGRVHLAKDAFKYTKRAMQDENI